MLMKILAAVALIVIILAVCTGIPALDKEGKIRGIKPGRHKTQVQQLLGPGQTNSTSDGVNHKSSPGREQYSYKGNPSLWYGRWEDELIVGYTNDIVSDTTRCGL